eukprot:8537229-Heterocapsa_arctica.AAC.1
MKPEVCLGHETGLKHVPGICGFKAPEINVTPYADIGLYRFAVDAPSSEPCAPSASDGLRGRFFDGF